MLEEKARGITAISALFQLLFLMSSVKILGEAAERIGVPSVMGEILAGISFGVFFLDIETGVVAFFDELGSIFLLFTAGYKEINFKELKSASVIALVPTLSQIIFAFAFGFLL